MDYSESAIPKPTRKRKKNHVRSRITKGKRAMEKELDGLLRNFVLARALFSCEWCKKRDLPLFSSHVLPKGAYPRLRFEPYNLMSLCYACHMGNKGWHKDIMGAREWFDKEYPGRYQDLQIAARNAPKIDLKLLLTVWRGASEEH